MADITEDDVTTALGGVIDPSQGKSVVDLAMVGPIHIKQSNISFSLEVPAHRGPAMEPSPQGSGNRRSRHSGRDQRHGGCDGPFGTGDDIGIGRWRG